MPSQKWRVLVTKLGVDNVLYEGDVDATNWMGALRAAREGMAERPSVPPGVSCSIDQQGVATVLDPGSRRRFVLAPSGVAIQAPVPTNNAKRAEPAIPANPTPTFGGNHGQPSQPEQPAQPAPTRAKRFETVAFVPDKVVERPVAVAGGGAPPPKAAPAPAPAATAAAPAPAPVEPAAPAAAPRKKKKFETVAFSPAMQGTAGGAVDPTPRDQPAVAPPVRVADSGPVAPAHAGRPSSAPGRRAGVELELLLERNAEPSEENPLFYCERAYLLPRGVSVPEAEAALRWKLADMQKTLEARRRGKLVNLAVFDHRWQEAPERPPVITLQWRDWRSEVVVDYPAAARHSSAPPPPSGGHDDRLADVFEALGALSRLGTAADALDFAVKLLERTVLSEAISACLYDINTDELRFVALVGTGADGLQGRAVARSSGLFGQAARLEHHASVFKDVFVEPAYDPEIDSRPGVDARTILLRPIVHEHQLLGMLQLINRKGGKLEFTGEDAHLVSYIAERLAEFINAARRHRSQQPPRR